MAYECSANQVAQYIPWPGATRVYHTNHPLANDDLRLTGEAVAQLSPERQDRYQKAMANTHTRFASLQLRLADTARPVTVEKAKEVLSSHDSAEHPVCRHKIPGQPAMTNACMAMELSESPALHVTSGLPCEREFKTLRFQAPRPRPM